MNPVTCHCEERKRLRGTKQSNLNNGIASPSARNDIPFFPHLTLKNLISEVELTEH